MTCCVHLPKIMQFYIINMFAFINLNKYCYIVVNTDARMGCADDAL